MKGNLAVLSLLGLFLIGAIWISVWAPEVAVERATTTSRSWSDYDAGKAPWADTADALETAKAAAAPYGKALPKDVSAQLASAQKAHDKVVGSLEKRGSKLYGLYCAQCHGPEGAGDGEAAKWLPVEPRHLGRGIYRFRSTFADINPTDADIYRTLSVGSLGSPMPGFEKVLSPEDRWALVAHVKSLSERWTKPGRMLKKNLAKRWVPIELALGPEPENLDELAAKHGPELYELACANCHGPEGYGDGPNAATQKDESGPEARDIRPRNFYRPWKFKRGRNARDVAYSVVTGLAGTGMPAHYNLLWGKGDSSAIETREKVWAVSQYVANLSNDRPQPIRPRWQDPGGRLARRADVEIWLRERAWQYERLLDRAKNTWGPVGKIEVPQGATVRLYFQPYDNGVGHGQGIALSGYERAVYASNRLVQDGMITITFRAMRAGEFPFYNPTQSAPGRILARMKGTLVVKPRATAAE